MTLSESVCLVRSVLAVSPQYTLLERQWLIKAWPPGDMGLASLS